MSLKHTPPHRHRPDKTNASAWRVLLWIAMLSVAVKPTLAADIQPPAKAQAIMPIGEIRLGMKGYGMSVFHGVDIEPFAVEVVSVMRDFQPNRGAIWVRCTDARMQANGAVQGMSGSPIYLWDDGEKHEPGVGGRLIGAFAFGFGEAKDCFIGVQPIEQMRAIREHAQADPPRPSASAGGVTQLRQLLDIGASRGVSADRMWRARAALALLRPGLPGEMPAPDAEPAFPLPPKVSRRSVNMMLPLTVGGAEVADMVAPLLEPMGLFPVAAPAGIRAGRPPTWLDMDKVTLKPGSVLSIPLVWGDADMSASGTVTDVLPDGSVLAFGHPMFNQGNTAVPMATGFVHAVIARRSISFKLGGSGDILGAVVRDESPGILGSRDGAFTSAPSHVTVEMPGHPREQFNYRVVHHPSLTPVLAAVAAIQSLGASQQPPPESTLHLRTRMTFEDGNAFDVTGISPGASTFDIMIHVVPLIATMGQNPFGSVKLKDIDVSLRVEHELRTGALTQVKLDHAELAPGDTIGALLRIQPHGDAPMHKRLELTIPEGTPDGDYQLTICGPAAYLQLLMASRPHLFVASSVDDMVRTLKRIFSIADDSLFAILQLRQEGLAVGQLELELLPSSRRALMTTPISTVTTPYVDWIEKTEQTGLVINGAVNFSIAVRADLKQTP